MKKIVALFFLFAILCSVPTAQACTTAVVSGKYTADGRPLMFKQRDSSDRNNFYLYVDNSRYAFIGVVTIYKNGERSVKYGQNEKGLCIMNSNSYNLEDPNLKEGTHGNIIRLGLEQCANVDEFEAMLKKMAPFTYGSNYGCFDAKGNCAYFECGAKGVKKYDANDSAVAPKGYIVRANFGYSGDLKKGKGYARYAQAVELFEKAADKHQLDVKTLMTFSRCLKHGWTKMDLNDWAPDNLNTETLVHFTDFIPRYTTASCVVYQGIKDGENPDLTTAWTSIGNPLFTVFVPIWMNKEFPKCMTQDATTKQCVLLNWSNAFHRYAFPIDYGEGENYLMLNRVINGEHTGILQRIQPIEDQIVAKGETLLEDFRKAGKQTDALKTYYQWVDTTVNDGYEKIASDLGLLN